MTYYPPVPTIQTELGTERLCRGCAEWWPLDGEFWYFAANGKVMGRCKACWSERNRDRHARLHHSPMMVAS